LRMATSGWCFWWRSDNCDNLCLQPDPFMQAPFLQAVHIRLNCAAIIKIFNCLNIFRSSGQKNGQKFEVLPLHRQWKTQALDGCLVMLHSGSKQDLTSSHLSLSVHLVRSRVPDHSVLMIVQLFYYEDQFWSHCQFSIFYKSGTGCVICRIHILVYWLIFIFCGFFHKFMAFLLSKFRSSRPNQG